MHRRVHIFLSGCMVLWEPAPDVCIRKKILISDIVNTFTTLHVGHVQMSDVFGQDSHKAAHKNNIIMFPETFFFIFAKKNVFSKKMYNIFLHKKKNMIFFRNTSTIQ